LDSLWRWQFCQSEFVLYHRQINTRLKMSAGGRPLRRRREMVLISGAPRLRGTAALQASSDHRCDECLAIVGRFPGGRPLRRRRETVSTSAHRGCEGPQPSRLLLTKVDESAARASVIHPTRNSFISGRDGLCVVPFFPALWGPEMISRTARRPSSHKKQTSAKMPRAMRRTGHPGFLAQATEPQVVL
jgi:hypothetical protein